VRLLDHDTALGALLLERAIPGTLLCDSETEQSSINTAATLMRKLWRDVPANSPFPTLERWFAAYDRYRVGPQSDLVHIELVETAAEILQSLFANSQIRLVLHGDLHHENILLSKHGWVAIDPKGVVGDPGYEVGPFMLNKLPRNADDQLIKNMLHHRLAIFSSELGIEKERLRLWAFCYAVLSALWDIEESSEPTHTIRIANLLAQLN
jgi:streptomycin 6-kinase